MLPTTHKLGIISINNTYGTGVHFIGLNNQFVKADSGDKSPYHFFMHDIGHALFRDVDNSQSLIHLRKKLNKLSKLEREAIEYIYFELTHELGVISEGLWDPRYVQNIVRQKITKRFIERYNRYREYKHYAEYIDSFLPFIPHHLPQKHSSIEKFLEESGNTFVEFISEAHEEMALSNR